MLRIEDISAGYGRTDVLYGVSLQVPAGGVVALVGANGAGKTTLARVVSGLLPARHGRIVFDGRVIGHASPGERLAMGLAHVPEGRQIFAGLSVADNLRLGAFGRRAEFGVAGIARRLDEVCALFPPLRERLRDLAGNLSGGQQQMLAIARALMSRPRCLILDEPSLGLSPLLVGDIFRLISGMRDAGLAVLLSEQNARLSLAIADHGYVLERGRITLDGPDLLRRPEVAERYLGVGSADAEAVRAGALRRTALASRLAAIIG